MKEKIGITTTVPVEAIIAAGFAPVDLNNIFVTSNDCQGYIEAAERDGFPKSMCAWIKGLYGACMINGIKKIVGVVQGDCSNTASLTEVLRLRGIDVIPFSYPHERSAENVKNELDRFMKLWGVDLKSVEAVRASLQGIRGKAILLDELTWRESKASGFENHLYQVSMSDFNSDPEVFEGELDSKLCEIEDREADEPRLRLGYIGVPPMMADLYEFAEQQGARMVYNEVQREFAFPRAGYAKNIYEQYADYTYPYDIDFRLKEIKKQIEERKLDGLVHYTQAFCHRALDDIIIKSRIDIPIINIEGDKSDRLDARTRLRLEAFLDMLCDRKEAL
ncbi:2-hydroxyglutaryl-CoA dehydratase, D-component [Peptoclostridium acidaminophilum DSM 3953]|uniref:2-hydroxyglutaryl-CoA dehydratase, D-component n=1 Tax=Peptoclostridium acidaminophilum DSM 3953 TaxID=1286171 RepID=W8TDS7_PEPAC|nr:2-hydroxyacyl-CoA dehydratase [Peptoclostridium acidaminophilum]AHM55978.1 2-hydroxyglutaryl-CoA dehydratase, D-component [Peptoclostridium acidaminophilum DSM 3953]